MNKRELKKSVNYICSELFAEGVAVSLYSQNADKDNDEEEHEALPQF